MALLQAHFTAPNVTPLIWERLLDTLVGALFAWAFSYVLPSWERRTLPAAVERALAALGAYSRIALSLEPGNHAGQRLARQRAYDALGVVSAALRRSAAEPKRVRPPVKDLVNALDHAQRLMAHLSSVRSLLQRRGERLTPSDTAAALAEARDTIVERLSTTAPATGLRPRPPSHAELPANPVELAPLPWLVRRLEACVYDAGEAGAAARQALAALTRRQI
jgi:uncharacterized membrane protein YccC